MRLWDRLRARFAWRLVKDTGPWRYYENAVTGCRRAVYVGPGHQPLDTTFVRGGDRVFGPRGIDVIWPAPLMDVVPSGGSGARRQER